MHELPDNGIITNQIKLQKHFLSHLQATKRMTETNAQHVLIQKELFAFLPSHSLHPTTSKQWVEQKFSFNSDTYLQTFSSAKASSCCLAFSTSSAGPLMVTLSIPEPSVGKWMCTPPHSSMMDRTKRPFDPIKELCSFEGMDTSTSEMFAWTTWQFIKANKTRFENNPSLNLKIKIKIPTHAKMSAYQILLNGQDPSPCCFTVCLLPSDDNHLWIAVLSRQINFGVRFLSNLQSKKIKEVSNQT